jgi:DNA-binding response OmpR family regulator
MVKIFIVDDEMVGLTLVGLMLNHGGFEVFKAQHAREVLERLEIEKPDLFIIDVMMPDINGIELCKILKDRADTKYLPVLFLSARTDTKSVLQAMEAGATDYLLKPIYPNVLVERVRSILAITG